MKKAYTLIEILIVATIIVLLSAAAAVSYSAFLKQSRDAKRKTDLEQIRAALEMYRSNNDEYTIAAFNGNCATVDWLGEYMGSIPPEPKSSSSFYYRCTITSNDYALGAYLESGGLGTGSCSNCKTGIACNYCVGPYGLE